MCCYRGAYDVQATKLDKLERSLEKLKQEKASLVGQVSHLNRTVKDQRTALKNSDVRYSMCCESVCLYTRITVSLPHTYTWTYTFWYITVTNCRNQSLEVQLVQMEAEIATLTKAQVELEEYKKKVEANAR